jgi:hypothetical protein
MWLAFSNYYCTIIVESKYPTAEQEERDQIECGQRLKDAGRTLQPVEKVYPKG